MDPFDPRFDLLYAHTVHKTLVPWQQNSLIVSDLEMALRQERM